MSADARDTLDRLLSERILILDGATGTMIQAHRLDEADFRGERFADHPLPLKGNNDILTLTRPDVVTGIHHAFLEAGADVIETNTFSSTAVGQGDYGTEAVVREMNAEAARLARAAADEWTARTPDRPRFVAGAIGPTNRLLSISPDVEDPAARSITFDELREAYAEQVRGLTQGGVDLLLVETIIDALNAKAAIVAIEQVAEETGTRPPVMISVTITDRSGRTLAGQTIEAFWITIAHARPFSVGPQLRPRRRRDAAVPRRAVARGRLLDDLLPERRPAQRLRRVRRAARADRRRAGRVRRERLRQHHGRLLRDHPGPHPGGRRRRRGQGAPAHPASRGRHPPRRPRAADPAARRQLHHDRRAHQRDRVARASPT